VNPAAFHWPPVVHLGWAAPFSEAPQPLEQAAPASCGNMVQSLYIDI